MLDKFTRRPGRRAAAPDGRVSGRRGFSLVEVVIAIVILAVGILSLGSSTAFIIRQITLGDVMTERAVAFQTVVNRIQSMPYDDVTTGTMTVGVFVVDWQAGPGAQSKLVRIRTTGPGMGATTGAPTNNPQLVETFSIRILRR